MVEQLIFIGGWILLIVSAIATVLSLGLIGPILNAIVEEDELPFIAILAPLLGAAFFGWIFVNSIHPITSGYWPGTTRHFCEEETTKQHILTYQGIKYKKPETVCVKYRTEEIYIEGYWHQLADSGKREER